MKVVYLMRHGRTSDNMKGILMGHNDSPLLAEAEKEIVSMRQYVIQPEIVFSSDLIRAQNTAQLLFPKHEVKALPLFRERKRGIFQGKPTRLWREANAKNTLAQGLEYDDAFAEAGVESLSSMRSRAEQVMEMMKKVEAAKVVVVSHGSFITCILRLIQPKSRILHTLPNLHYHKITLADDGTVIDVKTNQVWIK
jgi:broad specificity phosphatase PhoE